MPRAGLDASDVFLDDDASDVFIVANELASAQNTDVILFSWFRHRNEQRDMQPWFSYWVPRSPAAADGALSAKCSAAPMLKCSAAPSIAAPGSFHD